MFIVAVFLIYPSLADITATAIVTDRDSIQITDRRSLIHGIDAPEAKPSCKDRNVEEWACGDAATKYLTAFLLVNSVTCKEEDTDRYC